MKNELKNILTGFKNKRIMVWGDFILDEYILTTSQRISREAPVLVAEFESNMFRLGGAGNVVMNIKSLGATPIPIGFIGNNGDAISLKQILEQHQISTTHLVELQNYRTPKKSRILSGGENTKKQQVLRIDTLNKAVIPPAAYEKISAVLASQLADSDILIISDYLFQSVVPSVLRNLRALFPQKIIIIDSRYHLCEFKDITIATPNEPEIRKLFPGKSFLSESDFLDAGHELISILNARGLIIKRGHKGMMIFSPDAGPKILGIHGSSDIVDVTGAGDTVISVLGLALATGADLFSAAALANIAAGFVVMKEGAYAISKGELAHELD